MRGSVLSFSRPSSIMLVGLLILSTRFLWAQIALPLERIPIQLLGTTAPFARVSEVQTPLHLSYRRLPPTFEQNQGQIDSRIRFIPHYPGYSRPPITINAALYLGTWSTTGTASHGLASSSYETFNWLRLTRMSHVCSWYSSPNSELFAFRLAQNPHYTHLPDWESRRVANALAG